MNEIITILKAIILSLTILVGQLVIPTEIKFGAIVSTEQQIVSNLEQEETDYFNLKNKYEYKPFQLDGNLRKAVFEYQSAKGKVYQILLEKTEAGSVWRKGIGYG
ncbi:MAG: hypothetical protein AABY22_05970, partial [Nanoarchaeota archaeon]